jgi:hypothetical protein
MLSHIKIYRGDEIDKIDFNPKVAQPKSQFTGQEIQKSNDPHKLSQIKTLVNAINSTLDFAHNISSTSRPKFTIGATEQKKPVDVDNLYGFNLVAEVRKENKELEILFPNKPSGNVSVGEKKEVKTIGSVERSLEANLKTYNRDFPQNYKSYHKTNTFNTYGKGPEELKTSNFIDWENLFKNVLSKLNMFGGETNPFIKVLNTKWKNFETYVKPWLSKYYEEMFKWLKEKNISDYKKSALNFIEFKNKTENFSNTVECDIVVKELNDKANKIYEKEQRDKSLPPLSPIPAGESGISSQKSRTSLKSLAPISENYPKSAEISGSGEKPSSLLPSLGSNQPQPSVVISKKEPSTGASSLSSTTPIPPIPQQTTVIPPEIIYPETDYTINPETTEENTYTLVVNEGSQTPNFESIQVKVIPGTQKLKVLPSITGLSAFKNTIKEMEISNEYNIIPEIGNADNDQNNIFQFKSINTNLPPIYFNSNGEKLRTEIKTFKLRPKSAGQGHYLEEVQPLAARTNVMVPVTQLGSLRVPPRKQPTAELEELKIKSDIDEINKARAKYKELISSRNITNPIENDKMNAYLAEIDEMNKALSNQGSLDRNKLKQLIESLKKKEEELNKSLNLGKSARILSTPSTRTGSQIRSTKTRPQVPLSLSVLASTTPNPLGESFRGKTSGGARKFNMKELTKHNTTYDKNGKPRTQRRKMSVKMKRDKLKKLFKTQHANGNGNRFLNENPQFGKKLFVPRSRKNN